LAPGGRTTASAEGMHAPPAFHSEELQPDFPFTLCLKCHDRTRVALVEQNQSIALANLLCRHH
jgi:hypothetical protein